MGETRKRPEGGRDENGATREERKNEETDGIKDESRIDKVRNEKTREEQKSGRIGKEKSNAIIKRQGQHLHLRIEILAR